MALNSKRVLMSTEASFLVVVKACVETKTVYIEHVSWEANKVVVHLVSGNQNQERKLSLLDN